MVLFALLFACFWLLHVLIAHTDKQQISRRSEPLFILKKKSTFPAVLPRQVRALHGTGLRVGVHTNRHASV